MRAVKDTVDVASHKLMQDAVARAQVRACTAVMTCTRMCEGHAWACTADVACSSTSTHALWRQMGKKQHGLHAQSRQAQRACWWKQQCVLAGRAAGGHPAAPFQQRRREWQPAAQPAGAHAGRGSARERVRVGACPPCATITNHYVLTATCNCSPPRCPGPQTAPTAAAGRTAPPMAWHSRAAPTAAAAARSTAPATATASCS